jgi:hypothetical protein
MPTKYLEMAQLKYDALLTACSVYGALKGDKWKEKKPLKYFTAAETVCKVSNNLLINTPPEFQNLRHPTGCSLQYIAILNHMLDGPNWSEQYMNVFQENPPENTSIDINGLLAKLLSKMRNK